MGRFALSAVLFATPLAARADFTLQAASSADAMTAQRTPCQRPMALPVAHPAPPKPIAEGFGTDVPLTSALHQILPDGMQSQITPAVDPDAHVDWSGGRPWDVVLRDAVKPLGVKVLVTASGVVLIR